MKPFDVYPLFPIEPIGASGSMITDVNGTQYLDFYGGHAVISIGHGHPHYIKRITEQLNKIGFYSNAVRIPIQQELAAKLGELAGYPDYDLFLCNSGAEANENALKLASFQNGRKKVIAFRGSFHGRTSLAVAATDDRKIQAPINDGAQLVFCTLNDEADFLNHMNNDVCAVIVEGIQGVGGVQVPDATFLQLIRAQCDATGAVMILDEVQSGYGRTGEFFAHQYDGVKPDLITTAKGMGNGFPIAGVLISPVFEAKYGMLGTTFGGNHLACAAALAVLEVLESEQLIQHAFQLGNYLQTQLKAIPGVTRVRGLGLMIGIETELPFDQVRNTLLHRHHIFTGASSDKQTLRLLPALNLLKSHADQLLDSLQQTLRQPATA